MDFLSDTTKKERRNLLAAGFAGLIVAQLKIYPTDIELAGLKFHSPELPLIAIGGLCAAITYFLIKFCSSYLYEQSSAKTESLVIQIQEGKTAMDIAREEEALNEQARGFIQQRQVIQKQQENEARRIKSLQEKIDQEDSAHEISLKIMYQKRSDLEQALTKEDYQLAEKYIHAPQSTSLDKGRIEKEIKMLEESLTSYLRQRETKRQQDVQNLENEKNSRNQMYEAGVRMLEINQSALDQKRKAIVQWKQAHTTIGIVSPFHRFLELYLPILVGVIAVGGLISLMLHFPPPPTPPSLPEF